MNGDPLDNPAWNALNSHHQHLAIRKGIAARYQPEILMGGALFENTSSGFRDLGWLFETDETIGVFGLVTEDISGWQFLQNTKAKQMVCEELRSAPRVDAVVLTTEDVPEMQELVNIAQPGPFLRRTIEMGQYLGIRQNGRLVAMAGERLHLPGFCEVSAVCTHPDYRGRGYGSALTAMVAQAILDRQETPFLHVVPGNDGALRLYQKLGFRIRKEIPISFLKLLSKLFSSLNRAEAKESWALYNGHFHHFSAALRSAV